MISYRFAYGRGIGFIFKHWFSLLFVPLGLIALYTVAYLKFDTPISERPSIIGFNAFVASLGIAFRLGTLSNFGSEILSLSVWVMYLTVGWHYSKQVFGCMMVYAHYDHYRITRFQRNLIKASVFSVAVFNFFFFSIYAPQYSSNTTTQNFFFNIPIIAFGLPGFLIPLSGTVVVLLAALVFFKVILKKKKEHGLWPSQNFLVPWIAFHIWWIPLIRQSEYYFLAIPFFHSLQYLPFAYRLEKGNRKKEWSSVKSGIAVAVLLLIGISAFELVPGLLDEAMESVWYFKTWFFLIAFAVFINVHHFFIDSTLWKFNHPDVRRGLL